jgi:hypothetical protein
MVDAVFYLKMSFLAVFSKFSIFIEKLHILKGSSIVIVVNVNKNNNAQLNHRTVESIKDANTPLKISFTGKSSIFLTI